MFASLVDAEDQRQLRDSAADFVRREARPASGAKNGGEATAGAGPTRWQQMAELGWLAVVVPESSGGLGLTLAELAIIHQEAGRGALVEPLITVGLLAARCMALGNSDTLRAEVLPGLLSGRLMGTLAWQGEPGGLGSKQVGPVATPNGRHWRLTGRAAFVPSVSPCDGLVVAANEPGGVLIGWVAGTPNLPLQPATCADGTELAIDMNLEGLEIAPQHVIARGARGAEVLDDVLEVARIGASAELLGLMEQMLQMTLDYIRQRVQFGKPVGSFQALQHRAVDVYIQIELARSALHEALKAYVPGRPNPAACAAVSRAKSRCSEAALLTVKQCIQLHGAIAYTEEYALSRYIRRAIALAAFLGNAAAHRRRYAELALAEEGR